MQKIFGVKGLIVYQKSYALAMEIFHESKKFPKEEIYSLTNQIRKSSRSVCANISEGYSKRSYPDHFRSKLAIADGEAMETITWLDFAKDCGYISESTHHNFCDKDLEITRMLGKMIQNVEKFKPRGTETGSQPL
jgi:four helix bundle protein